MSDITKPKNFQIKISNCGLNNINGTYKIMKNKSALILSFKAVEMMTRDFVRDKSLALQYHLACIILSTIELNKEKLFKDIDNAKEIYEKQWVIK